ncbi:unnamed protein product [Prunus brigantina]
MKNVEFNYRTQSKWTDFARPIKNRVIEETCGLAKMSQGGETETDLLKPYLSKDAWINSVDLTKNKLAQFLNRAEPFLADWLSSSFSRRWLCQSATSTRSSCSLLHLTKPLPPDLKR